MSSKLQVVGVSCFTVDQVTLSALTSMRLPVLSGALVPLTMSVVSLVTKSLALVPVSTVIAVMFTVSPAAGFEVSIVTSCRAIVEGSTLPAMSITRAR
ncbi:hypothetical protein H8R02_28415 [Ramlibacter sp. GTP1]|uniref:Uncharacterized protein n=1 Tax=Ramlibacter albus TaxID=2079448 RepID=A0A923MF66_9BURK|nr:hypothetical protein [Ramlibacter albus]MBC5768418.1 hypothetical protein [Ramlibacter albus]